MIIELIKKVGEVTDKYTTISPIFTTNSYAWNEKEDKLKEVKVKWQLYIADTTNHKEFNTFAELERYINLLWLELKRVDTDAIKNAVEIADELLKKEKI